MRIVGWGNCEISIEECHCGCSLFQNKRVKKYPMCIFLDHNLIPYFMTYYKKLNNSSQ